MVRGIKKLKGRKKQVPSEAVKSHTRVKRDREATPCAEVGAPIPQTEKMEKKLVEDKNEEKRKDKKHAEPPRKRRKLSETAGEDGKSVAPLESWSGWTHIFFLGIEWENYDTIFSQPWDFSHVQNDLLQKNFRGRKYAYLFGTTEPQDVAGMGVVTIPSIVAMFTDSPVGPEKVAVKSVQMEKGRLMSFRALKLMWEELPDAKNIRILTCTQRSCAVGRITDEKKNMYTYSILHLLRKKDLVRMKEEMDTNIDVEVTLSNGKYIYFDFDMDTDDVESRTEEICEENEVEAKFADEINEAIRANIKRRKAEMKSEMQEAKELYESQDTAAVDAMIIVKYYPLPGPDMKHGDALQQWFTPFVNRYIGGADEMIPSPSRTAPS